MTDDTLTKAVRRYRLRPTLGILDRLNESARLRRKNDG